MSGVKRVVATDPAAVAALAGFAGLFAGLLLGVVIGLGGRRAPPRVQCSSTLRIEAVGPGAWTLVCEGGR